MTAAPALHSAIPAHLKHGGTQLIVTPESTRGHSKEESAQFPVWQWMVVRIEKRRVGKEFVGSYLY
jgi:hypothetical protein